MLKPADSRALPACYEVRHETVYSYSEAVPLLLGLLPGPTVQALAFA